MFTDPLLLFTIDVNHYPDYIGIPPEHAGTWGTIALKPSTGADAQLLDFSYSVESYVLETAEVPVPATLWLFGSALMALGLGKRRC